MEIYTIGFTQKTAEQFFGLLKSHEIERLVDIRLNPGGQLSGFAKQADLVYFLRELCAASYVHEPLLTPTKELLKGYRDRRYSWPDYERIFDQIMVDRKIADLLDRTQFEQRSVLLCSEATADQCHRRLVAEHLVRAWPGTSVTHL
ncbi:MAG: DUF488 domain-containing protein [Thermomicrobiales bacterium]|nr:DUF488 domain-containing protein [Thermomicrobiales bacterium]